MRRRLSRILKPCVAVLLVASFLAWQPVMTASMTRVDASTTHPTHTPGGHHQHPLPLQCCTFCTIACAAAPGIPGTAAVWMVPQIHHDVRPILGTDVLIVSTPQHRLPFSVGPPAFFLA
jgi:hypothetical protein